MDPVATVNDVALHLGDQKTVRAAIRKDMFLVLTTRSRGKQISTANCAVSLHRLMIPSFSSRFCLKHTGEEQSKLKFYMKFLPLIPHALAMTP